jgi:tetratricopeptide (TPR) repeat protein
MKRLQTCCGMVALLISLLVQGAAPDDEFVRVYNLIQRADALAETGQSKTAHQTYSEAQAGLLGMQKDHPGWNEKVIQFRLRYVAEKLNELAVREKPASAVATENQATESVEGSQAMANQTKLLHEQVRQLTAQKELLEAKLKESWSARPATADPWELARAEERNKSLQKEIELLKVKLEKGEAKPDERVDAEVFKETEKALAAAQRKLAQQKEILTTNALVLSVLRDALRLAKEENADLQRHRDDLQRKLDVVTRQLQESQPPGQFQNVKQLMDQLTVLRARLAALEARKVPYSREEWALLNSLATAPATSGPASGKRSGNESAAGAGLLMAEAERAVSARRFDDAARKYQEVLRSDGKNARVLAHLAAVQMEQNRLPEAEGNLRRALSGAPKDALSLTLLGRLKVRQRKFDEALEVLSQAAQMDPHNAETFQYLALTLAEKGLRAPAEAAFRRVIDLAPGHGGAHYQLAVLYATQPPPAFELARWHYQKAIEAGHAKNPALEKMLNESGVASPK